METLFVLLVMGSGDAAEDSEAWANTREAYIPTFKIETQPTETNDRS